MTGNDEIVWEAYRRDGCERAARLGNRGPMRFDEDGRLAQHILDAYHRTGFYVFTGVLSPEEVRELAFEFDQVLDNAPLNNDGEVDRHGRPSRFSSYYTVEPPESSDAEEHSEAVDAPGIVRMVSHPLMIMDSALRAYAHPDILKMAASVNGPDFVPFHESVFHKAARQGAPTRWHQDGRTHWDGRRDEPGTAGRVGQDARLQPVRVLVPLHAGERPLGGPRESPELAYRERRRVSPDHRMVAGCGAHDPVAGRLRHRQPKLVARLLSEPVFRAPGQHGDGLPQRASAIGAETTNVHAFVRPGQTKHIKYTEDYVLRRARMIPLAIDARRQHYPDEVPYEYHGSYIGDGVWNARTRAEISRECDEYWQRDITL